MGDKIITVVKSKSSSVSHVLKAIDTNCQFQFIVSSMVESYLFDFNILPEYFVYVYISMGIEISGTCSTSCSYYYLLTILYNTNDNTKNEHLH